MVALHAWVPDQRKPLALLGVAFMSMCAVVTCVVHFMVLALSRQSDVVSTEWVGFVFSFRWPSVAYALDILAWDFFFPGAALCAASSMSGDRFVTSTRVLLVASAILALVGLVGVPLANMNIRNIGIVGYALLFPIAAALMAMLFKRDVERKMSGSFR